MLEQEIRMRTKGLSYLEKLKYYSTEYRFHIRSHCVSRLLERASSLVCDVGVLLHPKETLWRTYPSLDTAPCFFELFPLLGARGAKRGALARPASQLLRRIISGIRGCCMQ